MVVVHTMRPHTLSARIKSHEPLDCSRDYSSTHFSKSVTILEIVGAIHLWTHLDDVKRENK